MLRHAEVSWSCEVKSTMIEQYQLIVLLVVQTQGTSYTGFHYIHAQQIPEEEELNDVIPMK